MKRQLFQFLFAAFISAIAFTACSKNADAPATGNDGGEGITKEKLVGSYKITELNEVSPTGTFDYLPTYNSCDRDNLFVLKADMTSAVVDAGEHCSPTSDDTGTWNFTGGTTIVLNGTTFKIKSLEGATLKMASTYTEGGVQKTLNMAYERQ